MLKENLSAEQIKFAHSRLTDAGTDVHSIIKLCRDMVATGRAGDGVSIFIAIEALAQRAGQGLDHCLVEIGDPGIGGFDHFKLPAPTSAAVGGGA